MLTRRDHVRPTSSFSGTTWDKVDESLPWSLKVFQLESRKKFPVLEWSRDPGAHDGGRRVSGLPPGKGQRGQLPPGGSQGILSSVQAPASCRTQGPRGSHAGTASGWGEEKSRESPLLPGGRWPPRALTRAGGCALVKERHILATLPPFRPEGPRGESLGSQS